MAIDIGFNPQNIRAVKRLNKNEAWMRTNWVGRHMKLVVWNTDKDAEFMKDLWFTPKGFRDDGKMIFTGSYDV